MDGKDSILSYNKKVEIEKKYVICNIYKPPNQIADDLNNFIGEFSSTLYFISNRHHSAYISCAFNIDLLQMYIYHY